MGQFISTLNNQKQIKPEIQFFINITLSKIKQYYSQYRNISDTFAIDDGQFIEIFGNTINVFQILDTDANLLIDGLELFTGLILLSRIIQLDDKIEFLFSLFDFNNLKSLSHTDMQFLFLSCLTVIHKLFTLKSAINQDNLRQFLSIEFNTHKRINISQFLKWANNSTEVAIFLQSILMKPLNKEIRTKLSSKLYIQLSQSKQFRTLLSSQQTYHEWIYNSMNLFTPNKQQQNSHKDQQNDNFSALSINPSINWVYGIHHHNIKQYIQYINYDNNQILIYLIGRIVVLYNMKSKQQQHYNQHRNQVICLSSYETVIASSQYALKPQIKIWDCKTLKTITTLRRVHIRGVHLLKFFKNGEYLISCGSSENSSVVIYNLFTEDIIYTYQCDSPTVEIATVHTILTTTINQFIICSICTIYRFIWQQQSSFQVCKICAQHYSRISCCIYLYLNEKFACLSSYDILQNKLILTGHEDGQVIVWNAISSKILFTLTKNNNQVLGLTIHNCQLYLYTDSSSIIVWDINLSHKKILHTIDITQLGLPLHSYQVHNLIIAKNILIVTKTGDIVQIYHNESINSNLLKWNFNQMQYIGQHIPEIISLSGNINRTITLQKQVIIIYYAGNNGNVIGIDTNTHCLCDCWNIGQPIICFDIYQSEQNGIIMIAATKSGSIYTRNNLVQNCENLRVNNYINDLLICNEGNLLVVACMELFLSIYSINSKGILTFLKHSITLHSIPMHLQILEKQVLLIVCMNNDRLIMSLKDGYCKLDNECNRKYSNTIIQLHYNNYELNKILPVLIGSHSKIIACGEINGTITIWRNATKILYSQKLELNAHNWACSDLIINNQQQLMYSTGKQDHMIVTWNLIFQNQSYCWFDKNKIQKNTNQYYDEIIDRQLMFCIFSNDILTQLYDQHVKIRGLKSEKLCKLFSGMMEEWKNMNKNIQIHETPNTSLKLQYVYGIQTYHKVSTLYYLDNPKRFIYFVAKVVIIYHPIRHIQHIYSGHKYKITSIALVSTQKQLVASAQSSFKPKINIWNAVTLQTIVIIDTIHRWGIIKLTCNNQRLLSFGLSNRQGSTYSVQLSSIKGICLGKYNTKEYIYSINLHPSNQDEFITTGNNNVTFWKLSESNLLKKSIITCNEEIITCCLFVQLPNNIVDVLVGTHSGHIGIVTYEHHFIILKRKAHLKRINCLMQMKHSNILLFMTCSQDQYIRIWSEQFQLLYEQNLKKITFVDHSQTLNDRKHNEINQKRTFAVQSLQYMYDSYDQLSILLGTRNGDVIQMIEQNNQTLFYPKVSSDMKNFKYILYMKNNVAQSVGNKMILMAHHPLISILVSVGEDQNLLFWDTDRNMLVFSWPLGYSQSSIPTALKFSLDGNFLIIGYSDGLLVFLDSKMSQSMQGKTDCKFIMPSLVILKRQKSQQSCAILKIQLSDSGDHLAVSYNHKFTTDKKKYTQSSISLFVRKYRNKSKNIDRNQSMKIFEKFTTISCHLAENTYVTDKGTKYGMAAYSMAFGEVQGKSYLLIYYQLIDSEQNRLNYTTDLEGSQGNYMVWDVNTSTVIANLDLINSLSWKKMCFHSAIYAKYQLYNDLVKTNVQLQNQPLSNNLLIPHMSVMQGLYSNLLLGSINGDIHVVRINALQYGSMIWKYPEISQMFVSKTYSAHCSEVNQLESNNDMSYVYSSGIHQQCIYKWCVCIAPCEPELYNSNDIDIFGQVPDKQLYFHHLKVFEEKSNHLNRHKDYVIDHQFQSTINIANVFGRTACNQRNNLYYDCCGHLIYYVPFALVLYYQKYEINHQKQSNKNKNNKQNIHKLCLRSSKTNKQYIYLVNKYVSILNQITSIHMCKNHRQIWVAYNGSNAGLILWQINGKIPINTVILNCLSWILMIRTSYNDTNLILYGLNSHYHGTLVLIDIRRQQVLALVSYAHKPAWNIKDMSFMPYSNTKIVTCGVQSTKLWSLMGNQLVSEDICFKNEETINLCLTFADDTLITGCEDGSIVIWKNQPIKQCKHESMISVLCNESDNPKSNLFISAGRDTFILVWSLNEINLEVIKKIIWYEPLQINFLQANKIIEHEIQSLHLYHGKLVMGTRQGWIYQINIINQLDHNKVNTSNKNMFNMIEKDNNLEKNNNLKFINNKTKIFQKSKIKIQLEQLSSNKQYDENINCTFKCKNQFIFHDEDITKALFFINNNNITQLYEITYSGTLYLWNICTSEMLWSYNFTSIVFDMLYSFRSGIVYIGFQEEIRCYKITTMEPYSSFNTSKISSLSAKKLTHMIMSNNQKILAIGINNEAHKSISIEIYHIGTIQQPFEMLIKIPLTSQIITIDFSINNTYLLIKTIQELTVKNLKTKKNENDQLSKIQWISDGLIHYYLVQPLINAYKQKVSNAKINKIIKYSYDKYIIIDNFANISIYTIDLELIGKCRLNITDVKACCISTDQQYLAVSSQLDSSIIILDMTKKL